MTQKDYKQETDKIETSIASGVTKDESYITHFPKQETEAPKELKQKIMSAMVNSYSKTNAIPAAKLKYSEFLKMVPVVLIGNWI